MALSSEGEGTIDRQRGKIADKAYKRHHMVNTYTSAITLLFHSHLYYSELVVASESCLKVGVKPTCELVTQGGGFGKTAVVTRQGTRATGNDDEVLFILRKKLYY